MGQNVLQRSVAHPFWGQKKQNLPFDFCEVSTGSWSAGVLGALKFNIIRRFPKDAIGAHDPSGRNSIHRILMANIKAVFATGFFIL